jgi:hypothetical protein
MPSKVDLLLQLQDGYRYFPATNPGFSPGSADWAARLT